MVISLSIQPLYAGSILVINHNLGVRGRPNHNQKSTLHQKSHFSPRIINRSNYIFVSGFVHFLIRSNLNGLHRLGGGNLTVTFRVFSF